MRRLTFLFLISWSTLSARDVYVSAQGGLVLRDIPERTGKALTLMPFGSAARFIGLSDKEETIEDKKSAWFRIEFGHTLGYAFGGFLSDSAPSGTSFHWNENETMFLIQMNAKGPPEDCGSGYAERQCRVIVYKDGKPILDEKREEAARWVGPREIAFSSGLAECAGGEFHSTRIDVITRRETGSTSSGFGNPGCGMPEAEAPPMISTMCTGKRCASVVTGKQSVLIYEGLPDWNRKGGALSGLRKLGEIPGGGMPQLSPDFDSLFLTIDGQKYEIQANGKIKKN